MRGNLRGVGPAQIPPPTAFVIAGVGVEDLSPPSQGGNPDPVTAARDGREVTGDEDRLLGGFAEKADGALVGVPRGNPFEAFVVEVGLIEGSLAPVETVQRLHQPVNALMRREGEKVPLQTLFVVPLFSLAEFAAHKQKFFAR